MYRNDSDIQKAGKETYHLEETIGEILLEVVEEEHPSKQNEIQRPFATRVDQEVNDLNLLLGFW